MAKLFLSYAREDRPLVEPLAHLLERAGHAVWWDRRIFGGSDFSFEIARELDAADVVIVAWSAASVSSHWVKDEAAEGRNRGRLVPLLLDGTPPPLGFRQIHGIDLSGWDGRGSPAAFEDLLRSIDLVAATPSVAPASPARPGGPAPAPSRAPDPPPARRHVAALVAVAAGLGLAAAVVLLAQQPWLPAPDAPDEPARRQADSTAAAAPSPADGGDADIDGRWTISWTLGGTPYRGTLVADGAAATIELDAMTSMGRQSVRQDCAVAGAAPVRVTCHDAQVVSGPSGYMPDSFTFERRGDTLEGTITDPLGLLSAPVVARRE